MSFTLGTNNQSGVSISVEFTFNGAAVDWGGANLYSMAPLSNRSESVDGSYELTDLNVELIDTNGSIWGSLGNGTTAFYKPFTATVYVGGQVDWTTYGPVGLQRLQRTNNNGAATYVIHSGQISEVSKRDRLVRIKSQNNLRALEDMEWRFPFSRFPISINNFYGSYAFINSHTGTDLPRAIFNWNENRDQFDMVVAASGSYQAALDTNYPSIAGRGTMGLGTETGLGSYTFPGTQFYSDFKLFKVNGTFLGTYHGTIEDLNSAKFYGYSSVSDAETAKSGTRYVINKTRLVIKDGTMPNNTFWYAQQNLTLQDTPANIFRELLTGHCVSPYFGTNDIEQTSFGSSQVVTTYLTFSQRIDPKGGKVLPYLKDLISSTYGQFSVNEANKFEYRAYGPRNLTSNIATVSGTTILDSELKNTRVNTKNRIKLTYAYNTDLDEFAKTVEVVGTPWAGTIDNPIQIKSQWIQNDDEALIFAQRLIRRFINTLPHIDLTVSMKHSGVGLGSLLTVVDPDSGLDNKVVEIVGFDKDFTEDRRIRFQCIDGEAVYSRKGFGQWMGGASLPSGDVSGTSTFGWGTSGTMANINTSIYGTQFVWF